LVFATFFVVFYQEKVISAIKIAKKAQDA